MVIASKMSAARGLLSQHDVERIIAVLQSLGLPTECEIEPIALFEALKRDKKRDGDGIHFVLLDRIGNAIVEKMSLNELEHIIHDMR
jgi:3-dehydroquinate synthase